jgi:hypothetical protein
MCVESATIQSVCRLGLGTGLHSQARIHNRIICLSQLKCMLEWDSTFSYSPFGWKKAFENIFDI